MRFRKVALPLLGLAVCAFAMGQENPAPKATVTLPASAKPGAVVKGTLTVTFGDGLHAYQNPASTPDLIPVAVSLETKGLKLKSVQYPAGKSEKVAGEDKPVAVYEGTIKIPITFVAPKKAGKTKLQFKFHYQQCNDQACFPPGDVDIAGTVTIKK